METRLVPITSANVHEVLGLRAAEPSSAAALAVAAATPGRQARAIIDAESGATVGLLVHGPDAASGRWRISDLLIDERFRRRGYGRSAIGRLVAELGPRRAVSQIYARTPESGQAAGFVAALGFAAAGDGAIALALPARAWAAPQVSLRDVTLENARACIGLAVGAEQARFVASNAASLVQSKFEPHWLTKAIYDGETMVGFVMYGRDPDFGWGVLRLMIDESFQGRGYGRAAMRLVLAEIRAAGGDSVGVSYEADNGVARRLYHSLGFVETGEQPFGEPFAVLSFAGTPA
ncbi:MAG TPA: GNAT family N-acetyltransferase [Herpetosiphonaceae bacterium]|nr:GNAT family N-acetyltransferase [Herpetosiphonaceae bacterium]